MRKWDIEAEFGGTRMNQEGSSQGEEVANQNIFPPLEKLKGSCDDKEAGWEEKILEKQANPDRQYMAARSWKDLCYIPNATLKGLNKTGKQCYLYYYKI